MFPDYTQITPDTIRHKVAAALKAAEALVDQLVAEDNQLTYDQVLAPLDRLASDLNTVYGETAFMGEVHTEEKTREAGREAEAQLREWANQLLFREDLYRTITRYSETDEARSLTGERARLLEFTQRDLRRAGQPALSRRPGAGQAENLPVGGTLGAVQHQYC